MMEGSCEDTANSNTIFSSLLFTFDHRTFRRHLNETKLNRHRILRCQLPELLRCYFDTLLREVALKRPAPRPCGRSAGCSFGHKSGARFELFHDIDVLRTRALQMRKGDLSYIARVYREWNHPLYRERHC